MNLSIYCFVRKTLQQNEQCAPDRNSMIERKEAKGRRQTQAIATQAFFYVGTYYLSYTPAMILRGIEGMGFDAYQEETIFPVLAWAACMAPLQGFFNVFIFVRPNYVYVRQLVPEQTRLWTLFHCLKEPDVKNYAISYSRSSRTMGSNKRSPRPSGKSPNNSRIRRNTNDSALSTDTGVKSKGSVGSNRPAVKFSLKNHHDRMKSAACRDSSVALSLFDDFSSIADLAECSVSKAVMLPSEEEGERPNVQRNESEVKEDDEPASRQLCTSENDLAKEHKADDEYARVPSEHEQAPDLQDSIRESFSNEEHSAKEGKTSTRVPSPSTRQHVPILQQKAPSSLVNIQESFSDEQEGATKGDGLPV